MVERIPINYGGKRGRKKICRMVEICSKGERSEGRGKKINRLRKLVAKLKFGERKGEEIYWLIELVTKSE